jgi:hypothetical protein
LPGLSFARALLTDLVFPAFVSTRTYAFMMTLLDLSVALALERRLREAVKERGSGAG